jgi:hypothetical protein
VIATAVPPRFDTVTGVVVRYEAEPSPSCPKSLYPQQKATCTRVLWVRLKHSKVAFPLPLRTEVDTVLPDAEDDGLNVLRRWRDQLVKDDLLHNTVTLSDLIAADNTQEALSHEASSATCFSIFVALQSRIVAAGAAKRALPELRALARLTGLQSHGGAAWLDTYPTSRHLIITDGGFHAHMRTALGLRNTNPAWPKHCPRCGDGIDATLMHFRSTCSCLWHTTRHDAVKYSTARVLKDVFRAQVQTERRAHNPTTHNAYKADILAKTDDRSFVIDVTITDVQGLDHMMHGGEVSVSTAIARATKHGAPAARAQHAKEHTMLKASLDTNAIRVPMALESTGRFSTATVTFIDTIAKDLAEAKSRTSAFRGSDRTRTAALAKSLRQGYITTLARTISVALANAEGLATAKLLRDAQAKHQPVT